VEEDMTHQAIFYERLAKVRHDERLRDAAAHRLVRLAEASHQVRQPKAMPGLGRLPNRQLIYLFVSSFTILFVGMGLFPVLPVYATGFGASRALIGLYYALMFAANAAGAMLTHRLAGYLSRRGLFITIGVLGVPALMLLGRATALWQVIVLTATVWFCGGVGLALVNIFTGLHAGRSSRGKSFSLMFLAFPLGAVFGGLAVGQLVQSANYLMMFIVLGGVWAILPIVGAFGLKDEDAPRAARSTVAAQPLDSRLGSMFYRLLFVVLLSAVAVNIGRLGTALSMQALRFSPSEIASTATVSGLLATPIVLLIGTLSDRWGRKRFLLAGYVLAAGGALTLAIATELWMFWLAATLILVALCTNGALSSALVADLVTSQAMQRGLPWISAMNPVAGVMSFVSIGYALDAFGPTPVYLVAATVAIVAALLLSSLRHAPPRSKTGSPTRPVVSVKTDLPIGKTA
jgi:MFS family permease